MQGPRGVKTIKTADLNIATLIQIHISERETIETMSFDARETMERIAEETFATLADPTRTAIEVYQSTGYFMAYAMHRGALTIIGTSAEPWWNTPLTEAAREWKATVKGATWFDAPVMLRP